MSPSSFALAMAAIAVAGAASAQPIRVVSAQGPARAPTPAPNCIVSPGAKAAGVECALSLTPPARGADAAPGRILVHVQWAPERCAPREAQAVRLSGPPMPTKGLPIVDQPRLGRGCAG